MFDGRIKMELNGGQINTNPTSHLVLKYGAIYFFSVTVRSNLILDQLVGVLFLISLDLMLIDYNIADVLTCLD